MRYYILACTLICSLIGIAVMSAESKTPPAKVTFQAKPGPVTFDHAAHAKREKNVCKTCHTALFAQDAKEPVKFRPPHKTDEEKKASCGFCHRTGGEAFASTGKCTTCHVKAAATKG
jgi:c(7)-type cytochrome triheme protein